MSTQKKSDFTVDEGKGGLNPSRDKNQGKHRRRKVEKSCVAFVLCDPGWCVHKSDVQNKWDDSTTYSISRRTSIDKVGCCRLPTASVLGNKADKPCSYHFVINSKV